MKTSGNLLLRLISLVPVGVVILIIGCLMNPMLGLAEQAGANVLFILDGSGSMWGRLDTVEKIVIAKERLSELVNDLPENVNIGLMVYGHRSKGDCNDIELMTPVGPGNRERILAQMQTIIPKGKTPITQSIALAAQQLETLEDETNIVLVSDGEETCASDPCAYTKTQKEELAAKGITFTMHVVGFDVNAAQRTQLECIANAGGGRYFSAQNAMQLKAAFTEVKKEVTKKKEKSKVGSWEVSSDKLTWEPVSLPHTDWRCDNCTRFYRTRISGKPMQIRFRWASDNKARLWLNNSIIFDDFWLPKYCTDAPCCSKCCDSPRDCLSTLSSWYNVDLSNFSNRVNDENVVMWEVYQEWGGSGFHTEMEVIYE